MSKSPEGKTQRYDAGWMLNQVKSVTRKRRKRRADKQRRRKEREDTRSRISDL